VRRGVGDNVDRPVGSALQPLSPPGGEWNMAAGGWACALSVEEEVCSQRGLAANWGVSSELEGLAANWKYVAERFDSPQQRQVLPDRHIYKRTATTYRLINSRTVIQRFFFIKETTTGDFDLCFFI
jgi:hypothetical protein